MKRGSSWRKRRPVSRFLTRGSRHAGATASVSIRCAVSLTEPEAAIQLQKRGRGFAPAYTPSALANEARLIVAHAIDPTSETRVIGELLDQSERVVPETQRELLLDAGYFDDGVIEATLARDVSLLCPPKPSTTDKVGGLYHKSQFAYDADQDVYLCPAGQRLRRISHARASARSREQFIYACDHCAACPQRTACTRSTQERRIKRYPEDEVRLALQQVMPPRVPRTSFDSARPWSSRYFPRYVSSRA